MLMMPIESGVGLVDEFVMLMSIGFRSLRELGTVQSAGSSSVMEDVTARKIQILRPMHSKFASTRFSLTLTGNRKRLVFTKRVSSRSKGNVKPLEISNTCKGSININLNAIKHIQWVSLFLDTPDQPTRPIKRSEQAQYESKNCSDASSRTQAPKHKSTTTSTLTLRAAQCREVRADHNLQERCSHRNGPGGRAESEPEGGDRVEASCMCKGAARWRRGTWFCHSAKTSR